MIEETTVKYSCDGCGATETVTFKNDHLDLPRSWSIIRTQLSGGSSNEMCICDKCRAAISDESNRIFAEHRKSNGFEYVPGAGWVHADQQEGLE